MSGKKATCPRSSSHQCCSGGCSHEGVDEYRALEDTSRYYKISVSSGKAQDKQMHDGAEKKKMKSNFMHTSTFLLEA